MVANASASRRPGWPEDDLPHPYEEPEAADDPDGNDGPDSKGEQKKGQQLLAPPGSPVARCRGNSSTVLGHRIRIALDWVRSSSAVFT